MSENILDTFVEAIHQRHGHGVVALDMSDVPLTMEAFLLTTAENRIQARAIADQVEETARSNGFRKHHIEGYDEGSWILMDYVDLVVHIFLPGTREYYDLEMLWNDVPSIEYDETEKPSG
ncbi:MAG: ribosome silencing factor [Candidatus Aegiribacteria sp.]|nr:ribosome silencing factor [Candidatus Aegiribacteria sp.]